MRQGLQHLRPLTHKRLSTATANDMVYPLHCHYTCLRKSMDITPSARRDGSAPRQWPGRTPGTRQLAGRTVHSAAGILDQLRRPMQTLWGYLRPTVRYGSTFQKRNFADRNGFLGRLVPGWTWENAIRHLAMRELFVSGGSSTDYTTRMISRAVRVIHFDPNPVVWGYRAQEYTWYAMNTWYSDHHSPPRSAWSPPNRT